MNDESDFDQRLDDSVLLIMTFPVHLALDIKNQELVTIADVGGHSDALVSRKDETLWTHLGQCVGMNSTGW